MKDLELIDRFGPRPTDPTPAAMDAARGRLNAAMRQAGPGERRWHRRLPLMVAAAAGAVGLAIAPGLTGSDRSVALAAVDPLTFPLTPAAVPAGLSDPVFESDSNFVAARYGSVLNGLSVVTDVADQDFWDVPGSAATTTINGRQATLIGRTVYDGTSHSARGVSIIWQEDDQTWTAVTGSGHYADTSRVEAFAESLREDPQPVDLALSVAPEGWDVSRYKDDRILTLAAPGGGGRDELTVALAAQLSENLAEYGAQDVETLAVNGRHAHLGRQAAESGDPTWILEAQTASGQAFSLQAPASLDRDQVVQIAKGVTYTP